MGAGLKPGLRLGFGVVCGGVVRAAGPRGLVGGGGGSSPHDLPQISCLCAAHSLETWQ